MCGWWVGMGAPARYGERPARFELEFDEAEAKDSASERSEGVISQGVGAASIGSAMTLFQKRENRFISIYLSSYLPAVSYTHLTLPTILLV